jgi:hypothetical protein
MPMYVTQVSYWDSSDWGRFFRCLNAQEANRDEWMYRKCNVAWAVLLLNPGLACRSELRMFSTLLNKSLQRQSHCFHSVMGTTGSGKSTVWCIVYWDSILNLNLSQFTNNLVSGSNLKVSNRLGSCTEEATSSTFDCLPLHTCKIFLILATGRHIHCQPIGCNSEGYDGTTNAKYV